MVKELKRKSDANVSDSGIIIPEETMEDDEVAQGTIISSSEEEYKAGDVILFHKTLPVDALLKMEGDDRPTEYFFVNSRDVVCKIEA